MGRGTRTSQGRFREESRKPVSTPKLYMRRDGGVELPSLRAMTLAIKALLWASVAGSSCLLAQQANPRQIVRSGSIGADGAYRAGNGVTAPAVLTREGAAIPNLRCNRGRQAMFCCWLLFRQTEPSVIS